MTTPDMNRFLFLLFVLICNCTILQAQPTFEEPGDPGFRPEIQKQLAVYPNPSTGSFSVALDSCNNEKRTIVVLNSFGMKVATQAIGASCRDTVAQFHLPEALPGMYIVKVVGEDPDRTYRLLIVH
jgi:hypothetical protein